MGPSLHQKEDVLLIGEREEADKGKEEDVRGTWKLLDLPLKVMPSIEDQSFSWPFFRMTWPSPPNSSTWNCQPSSLRSTTLPDASMPNPSLAVVPLSFRGAGPASKAAWAVRAKS